MRVYLDNAATTKVSQDVIEEMLHCLSNHFGNPSSTHAEGRKARTIIEDARKKIAQYLHCSVGEIFFTSGGTESNNMALKCAVRDLDVRRIITSPIEHHCVLHSIESLAEKGVIVDYLNVDAYGRIDEEELYHLLNDSSAPRTLVSLMHANNEIGTLLNISRIAQICKENNALFHSDTVQSTAHIPLDLSKLQIDFISGSAHKFHGPKGIGFIYINGNTKIKTFIDGGGQERNMRGGTENLVGIVGLAKAFEIANEKMEERKRYILEIRDYFKQQLTANFDGLQFNGIQEGDFLYTVLNVAFPSNEKSDLLLLHLDIAGISASGGSACSSGTDTGSHVIRTIKPENNNYKSVRFSFSHYNTKEEIDYVLSKLKNLFPQKAYA